MILWENSQEVNIMKNEISIFGAGGYAKEAYEIISSSNQFSVKNFVVSDDHYSSKIFMGYPIIKQSEFSKTEANLVIAIGDCNVRKNIVKSFPKETNFKTIIHPSAVISPSSKIGAGSIISANAIVSIDVVIGDHAQINFHSSIGHDCNIGDFFTACPGSRVSGSCEIGNQVFLGTNCSLKQNLSIADNVNLGIGAVILSDIDSKGTYFGNPARRMR